jgi:DNA replication protein DnaC
MPETKQIVVNCDKHGERKLTHHLLNGSWYGSEICDLCRSEFDQQDKERKQKKQQELAFAARNAELKAAIGRAAIPPKYTGKGFDHYEIKSPEQRRIYNVCKDYAENFLGHRDTGRSLILVGSWGTGKTHLACAIANYIMVELRQTALYMSTSQAMRLIKSTYSQAATITTDQAIQQLVKPDLLILDEVGRQHGSQAEKHLLLEIIDARYQQNKATILASNVSLDELSAYVTPQGVDRLCENGGRLLVFNWESARPTLTSIAAH